MKKGLNIYFLALLAIFGFSSYAIAQIELSNSNRQIIERNFDRVTYFLGQYKRELGNKVKLQVLASKYKLKLFMADNSGNYKFIRDYKICHTSKSPQKFSIGKYLVENSSLYAHQSLPKIKLNSLNIKKKFRAEISANCAKPKSIALTDSDMEEIYTIIFAAHSKGQAKIQVEIIK